MGFCRFTCKISSHLLVRNQQKTPRIIVPHRKHSLAKRVFEVELVFVSCDVSPGEKMLLWYMLDMLVVLLVQKRQKINKVRSCSHDEVPKHSQKICPTPSDSLNCVGTGAQRGRGDSNLGQGINGSQRVSIQHPVWV